jgi:hypothetical protein
LLLSFIRHPPHEDGEDVAPMREGIISWFLALASSLKAVEIQTCFFFDNKEV